MAGFIPGLVPGGESDEERKRRETIEANERATRESNEAFARQQAEAALRGPPAAPVAVEPPPEADPIAAAAIPEGMAVPIPTGEAPPALEVKRPDGSAGRVKKDAPPPPAAPGATMTTRAGPVSVQTPLAPGADLSQNTSRGGRSTSQRQVSPEEKAHQEKIADIERKSMEEADLIDKERAAKANSEAVVAAARDADTQWQLNQHEAEIQKRQAAADAADQEYRKSYAEWRRDPKERFWASKDTGDKVTAGISILLGIFGGLNDGSNVGAERIEKAIDADEAKYRQMVDDSLGMLNRSRGDVETAKANWKQKKELIDVKYASILGSIVADADARARRLGISEEEMLKNPGRQKLLDGQAARMQKWMESTSASVNQEQAWSRMNTTAGGPNGKGGLGTENDKRYAIFGKGMIDDLAIVGDGSILSPQVLERVQSNANRMEATDKAGDKSILASIGVAGARGMGLVPKSRYEGLKPAEQRAMNAIDNAGEKLYRIYTGAGMPQDEARRMVMQGAPHAGDSPQAIREKLARWDAEARRMTVLGGKASAQIADVERQGGGGVAANPAAPQQGAPVSRFRDKAGRVFMGRRLPDGSIEEVQ